MKELEYLEEELKKQEFEFQTKVFNFIKNASMTDIVDWSCYGGDYDISIAQDNIAIDINIEWLDDKKGYYYHYIITVKQNDNCIFNMSFSDRNLDYSYAISVINEKISQVKILEEERIKKEEEMKKQERIEYLEGEIAEYKRLNQIFG